MEIVLPRTRDKTREKFDSPVISHELSRRIQGIFVLLLVGTTVYFNQTPGPEPKDIASGAVPVDPKITIIPVLATETPLPTTTATATVPAAKPSRTAVVTSKQVDAKAPPKPSAIAVRIEARPSLTPIGPDGKSVWQPIPVKYGEKDNPGLTRVVVPAGETRFLVFQAGLKVDLAEITDVRGNFSQIGLRKPNRPGLVMFDGGNIAKGDIKDLVWVDEFLNGRADNPPVKGGLNLEQTKFSGKTAAAAFLAVAQNSGTSEVSFTIKTTGIAGECDASNTGSYKEDIGGDGTVETWVTCKEDLLRANGVIK